MIVSEWVEGEPLTWHRLRVKPEILRQIAALQASIHALRPAESESSVGFDYIAYLRQRAERARGIHHLYGALEVLDEALGRFPEDQRDMLSHPDFTVVNFIEDGSGALKMVDNELINQSPLFLVDLFNTARQMDRLAGADAVHMYLQHYEASGGSLNDLQADRLQYLAVWQLRNLGAMLESGAIERAQRLARRVASGEWMDDVHPVLVSGA